MIKPTTPKYLYEAQEVFSREDKVVRPTGKAPKFPKAARQSRAPSAKL